MILFLTSIGYLKNKKMRLENSKKNLNKINKKK